MNHKPAINILKARIEQLKSELSATNGCSDLIQQKQDLQDSIELLSKLDAIKISKKAKVVKLPFAKYSGHFSEYRVMDDNETETREDWSELEIEGEETRITPGDILIIN